MQKYVEQVDAKWYGDNHVMQITEDMLPDPLSPYAVTKLDGEFYCAMFRRAGLLETVALRYFTLLGPRQDP